MKLRQRFIVWFGLAALVPIAVATLITRQVVTNKRLAEFDRILQQAKSQAEADIALLRKSVRQSVDQLASQENPLVGGLLVELNKGDGAITPAAQFDLKQRAPDMMQLAGLDSVVIVGRDDVTLIAPHFVAHVGEIDTMPRALARRFSSEAVLAWSEELRQGKMTRVLRMQASKIIVDEDQEIAVLGGLEIGEQLVKNLRQAGVVEVRLLDSADNDLVPPSVDPDSIAFAPTTSVAIPGMDQTSGARIVIAVPDEALQKTLRDFNVIAILLAGLALLAALTLGFLTSRRITRHLNAVVAGAQAVARGQLDHRVEVNSTDEIGDLGRAFNQMTEDLLDSKQRLVQAERVAAWQDVARQIAHEIKNPLTPIQMSVETMRRTHATQHPSFDEIFTESTSTILEEVQRLKRIVTEFSEFARMPKPDRQPCDLDDLVSGALALYQGSVTVERDLAGDLPPIHADRDQMTQVIVNLLENARDAIGADQQGNGRITVRSRGHNGIAELVIEDNGPGFDDQTAAKIFTPYFTTKNSGTGLGLAIVERIVTDHGGRISVSSQPGAGAKFSIRLPVRPTAN